MVSPGPNANRTPYGDVIWTEPGVKHWHGGTADTAMTHIAIQGFVDGRPVDWMEHVTDDEYCQ
jgi:quercetin dioxygenase-like cupin family protein